MTLTAPTIEELYNPALVSDYSGVQRHPNAFRTKRYRVNNAPQYDVPWGTFPWRETGKEAAQDLVDFFNGVTLSGQRHVVRSRRPAQGWFDVIKEDGNEWIDTPPQAPSRVVNKPPTRPTDPERQFMLTGAFQKAVHDLPPDCVAEAKASAALSALQYGTGQVLVKRALRGLAAFPAFLIVPVEPHPDHKAAVESLGVKVIVP